ncbi:MAG: hypothetical protein FH758_03850 [Firmicutes bacterium]|nr:hypothetical protein [Bacillota bacterium]
MFLFTEVNDGGDEKCSVQQFTRLVRNEGTMLAKNLEKVVSVFKDFVQRNIVTFQKQIKTIERLTKKIFWLTFAVTIAVLLSAVSAGLGFEIYKMFY